MDGLGIIEAAAHKEKEKQQMRCVTSIKPALGRVNVLMDDAWVYLCVFLRVII